METKTLLKDDFHILIKLAKIGLKTTLANAYTQKGVTEFSIKTLKECIKKLEFEDAKLEMEKYED